MNDAKREQVIDGAASTLWFLRRKLIVALALAGILLGCNQSSETTQEHGVARGAIAQCTSGETCSLFDPYTNGHAPGWGAGVIQDKARYTAVDTKVIRLS